MSFAQFKHRFFTGGLFSFTDSKGEKARIVPNMKMVITYNGSYEAIKDRFAYVASVIQDSFNDIKNKFGKKNFRFSLFCFDHVTFDFDSYGFPSEIWKFIEHNRATDDGSVSEDTYRIAKHKYAYIGQNLNRYLAQAAPNEGGKYIAYLTMPEKGSPVQSSS